MNLWKENTLQNFWQCQTVIDDGVWLQAVQNALPILGLLAEPSDQASLAAYILGEERFGSDHWNLSFPKRVYYQLKPLLPRPLIKKMRQIYGKQEDDTLSLNWPIEDRYPRFLWEAMRQLILLTGKERIKFQNFWRDSAKYAFVLTHDIETAKGQTFVHRIAELEADLGFRSSFNFVPERYPLDRKLIQDLKDKGFEVGVHGLKHDGKLFFSRKKFDRRVKKINGYLKQFQAVGFRTPLTHRNPHWMQALEIEYDLSFFDTDPFESIPGGTMSIYPFMIGRFIELPYTLPQDYTLVEVLNDKTPNLWLDKVEMIEKYHGMVLLNSHPDYLIDKENWNVYENFLISMKEKTGYWHTIPQEVASWWRSRTDGELKSHQYLTAKLSDQEIAISSSAID